MDYEARKNTPPQKRPRLHRTSFVGEILRTIIFVVAVTALFDMAIPRSLVDGRSMEPTFVDQERLIVSRLHYLVAPPQRGDIVVFNTLDTSPARADEMLIKRVIGVPGDSVEFRNAILYVNDLQVDEPYINPCNSRCSDRRWELTTDEYFVMGDNRDRSSDSRSFGPVPFNHIVGTVVFRYWTLDRFGVIQSFNYEQ